MFDRVAIKARAREILNLNLGHLIGAYALAVLLPSLLSSGSSSSNSATSSWLQLVGQHGASRGDLLWPFIAVFLSVFVLLVVVFALALSAVSLVGTGAFQRMSLMAYDGVDVRVGDLLGIKDYWLKLLGLYLWIALRIIAWSLLFIIPGIIAAYSYALAPYLMFEDPSKGINQVIDESTALMRGYKGELFLFDLSFIGWWLLGLVTFGIATLWVGPYYYIARAGAYRAIRYMATNRHAAAFTPAVATNPSIVTGEVAEQDNAVSEEVAQEAAEDTDSVAEQTAEVAESVIEQIDAER